MHFRNTHIAAIAYELPHHVITSTELEAQLAPVYEKLRIAPGQLEALTGITERRWWPENFSLSEAATLAAQKALAKTNLQPSDIQTLIYTGVCRENFEPATACAVAANLNISPDAYVYDLSNACLGVLNGIIDIANRIELGQITAGMVVSAESARDINTTMIQKMLDNPTIQNFTTSLATLTGGSGAVAVILTHQSLMRDHRRQILAATTQAAPQHHKLCRWGLEPTPSSLKPQASSQFMSTDSSAVLKHGVSLGQQTWAKFLQTLHLTADQIDKVICHQVGAGHRLTVLKALGIAPEKDFSTFAHLGNIGTVSLPLTAAMAEQRHHLKPNDLVAFLGIGSGLNCMMLACRW